MHSRKVFPERLRGLVHGNEADEGGNGKAKSTKNPAPHTYTGLLPMRSIYHRTFPRAATLTSSTVPSSPTRKTSSWRFTVLQTWFGMPPPPPPPPTPPPS